MYFVAKSLHNSLLISKKLLWKHLKVLLSFSNKVIKQESVPGSRFQDASATLYKGNNRGYCISVYCVFYNWVEEYGKWVQIPSRSQKYVLRCDTSYNIAFHKFILPVHLAIIIQL